MDEHALSLPVTSFIKPIFFMTGIQNHTLPKDPACGNTVGCFAKCSGGQCDFIVSWNDTGEHIQFEMKKKFPDQDPVDHWIAVGLSEDKRMVTGRKW